MTYIQNVISMLSKITLDEDESVGEKVKLATAVDGDSKAPLSIATTPTSGRGLNSILWIATLHPWSLP